MIKKRVCKRREQMEAAVYGSESCPVVWAPMDLSGQAVFVDTNIGTHLAISVPPDIIVRDFIREFEREHIESFPTSGEIQVSALMVEREASFYRLSDSMSLKSVFQRQEFDWFLHAEAIILSESNQNVVKQEQDHCVHDCVASQVAVNVSEGSDISHPSNPEFFSTTTKVINKEICKRWSGRKGKQIQPQLLPGKLGKHNFFTRKRKRKRRKNIYLPSTLGQSGAEIFTIDNSMHIDEKEIATIDDCETCQEIEPAEQQLAYISRRDRFNETSSEAVVSVSGIINKYFPSLSEDVSPTTSVASKAHSSSIKFSAKKLLPPSASSSPAGFGGKRFSKHGKPEVGERLLMASFGLGISPSKANPVVRLCSFIQDEPNCKFDHIVNPCNKTVRK